MTSSIDYIGKLYRSSSGISMSSVRIRKHYTIWHTNTVVLQPLFCRYINVNHFVGGTSIWLTVSFALERYIAVCHPLRGRVLCTESRARKVISGVVIFNVLATLTTSFEWTTCLKNNNTIHLVETELGNNTMYKAIYYWFTAFVFVYIPLALLCVLNTLLVQTVRNSQKQRNGMTQVNTEKCFEIVRNISIKFKAASTLRLKAK